MTLEKRNRLIEAHYNAAANWARWKDDYNFSGKWSERPLLTNPDRFDLFCSEYSLSRNIPGNPSIKETSAQARSRKIELSKARRKVVQCYLRSLVFAEEIDVERTATSIAEKANGEHNIDGTELPRLEGRSRVSASISLISKVLCFLDPVKFPPIDRLNRKGIGFSSNSRDYQKFCKQLRCACERDELAVSYQELKLGFPTILLPCEEEKWKERFFWRVVDNYYMLLGSEKFSGTKKK